MSICFRCEGGKIGNVLRQQHFASVFIYQLTQRLVGNEQSGSSIFHHEVQTLLRISGVQRLVGTAGLQHAERGNSHPLAARNDDRHGIANAQALGCDIGCYAVTDIVHLGVCVTMVLEDDGFGIWRCLGLTAEQRYHRLGVIVWPVGIVERVKQRQLRCVGNPDVRELGLSK